MQYIGYSIYSHSQFLRMTYVITDCAKWLKTLTEITLIIKLGPSI